MTDTHPTLDESRQLAKLLLRGQVDAQGVPLFDHVVRVVTSLQASAFNTAPVIHTAWLHDLVEDTGLRLRDLQVMGYHPGIVGAVGLLTHEKKQEPYEMYLRRIIASRNPIALPVKLYDVRDNTNTGRLAGLPESSREYFRARYGGVEDRLRAALTYLGEAA